MEPEKGKAKGRARGRARRQQQSQVQPGAGQQVPPPVQVPAPRAAYRGAERPGGLQARLSQGAEPAELDVAGLSLESNGNNKNGKRTLGRGQLRGRREIGQVYQSRPDVDAQKTGQGDEINVIANYYEFKKNENWKLFQYHVDFSPDEDRTFERKKLVRLHKSILQANFIFDGSTLFSTERIAKKNMTVEGKKEEDGSFYKITFTYIKDLHHFDIQYIQILNIILRRCQENLGLKLVGRNYYNPRGEIKVQKQNLVIWPGFSTSIRHHEKSILMNVDVSHKVIRNETFLNALDDLKTKRAPEDSLLGCIVMTKYNSKTYRVDLIDHSLSPRSTFKYLDGSEVSYNDYYKKKYNATIQRQNQPLLKSIPKERDRRRGDTNDIILVPELCTMTGITDDMRNNYSVMKDLAEYTKPDPRKRVDTLQDFNKKLRANPKVSAELKSWNLDLSPELVQLKGHLAKDESICQGLAAQPNNWYNYNRAEADWSRPSRGRRMTEAVALNKWSLVYQDRNLHETKLFLEDFLSVGRAMGMTIGDPIKIKAENDSVPAYYQALKNCKGSQLIMVVLSNNRADRYCALKREICNNMGIPSQFLLGRTISKPSRKSIATKVAIQVNCKLGGEPWNVDMPLKGMFVGYDTHHHSRLKGHSFGATVASYNKSGTKYFGTVSQHNSNEELSNNFYQSIQACILNYHEHNNSLPPTIIIYRDGVGDSQIQYVKEVEIRAIKQMMEDKFKEHCPKLVFIVVSKRINTRLFSSNRGGIVNPPPGTIVDSVITLPERFDFFLVSQAIRQGTVSPTSYNVIENQSTLTADHLQRLAYKMCHLYYNWQGTVATPAPCMYAHKLAFMSGNATHEKVHPNLANKLWYL